MKTVGIIGMGNMGRALYARLADALGGERVFAYDRNGEKMRDVLEARRAMDAQTLADAVDVVILAVKPQSFSELSLSCEGKLVISIMAGVSLAHLAQRTGTERVVRAMPNLPARVGKGMTGWVASEQVAADEKSFVTELFSLFGVQVPLEKEEMIDAFTAVSGSGPAYFFYLAELLEEKAKAFGFSDADARMLAGQTFLGAAAIFAEGGKTAREWREAVTSKGGTTEAALGVLQEKNIDEIMGAALNAAKKRSEELSQG